MKFAKRTAGVGAIAIAALLAACDRDASEESPANDNPATTASGITSNPTATTEGQPSESPGSAGGSPTGAGTDGPATGTDPKGTAEAAAAAGAQGSADMAAKVSPSAAGSDSAPTLSAEDREFVVKAASSGMLEVEAGRLAAENAGDPEIRAFASMLVVDHSRTNAELNVLASMRNLVLPGDMAADHRAAFDRLRNASGADFDREFVATAGIKAHEEAIALFEGAENSVSDPALKEWIGKTLPGLRQHLEQARKLPGGSN